MKQLVKMIPIEPYTFGTDQKFQYPDQKATGKESYFVKSRTIPEQTTILGMLRFMILRQKGILRADFQYNEEQRIQMAKYIGSYSFRFGQEKQEFGCIHSISPVFLMDGEGNYYVKNPFHNMEQEKGYKPMELSDKTVGTSFGRLRLPKEEEYHAKEGHASGYYNLSNGNIHKNLFSSVIVPGNRKNNKISDDDCFFKRELIILKKGYCFAVFVDADELFQTDTVSMGLGGCMFLVTSEADREDDLEERTREAFAGNGCGDKDVWWYALSDLVVQNQHRNVILDAACSTKSEALKSNEIPNIYKTFCIVEQKQMRNLTTKYSEQVRHRKLRLGEKQMNMIQSGSVFFERCDLNIDNENCRQIGYNRIVKLGGCSHVSNNV